MPQWTTIWPKSRRKGGQVRFTAEQTNTLESRFDTEKYLSPNVSFIRNLHLKLGHQFGSQAGATSKLELTLKLNKCKTEDYLCIVEQPWNNVKTLGPTKIGKETRSVRAPSKNLVSKPSRKMASTKVWRFAWWREGRSNNWKLGKSLKRVIVPVISCNFLDEPFKRTPVKPALYEQESSDDDIGDIC